METDCEILWVELTAILDLVLFGVFYCPPGLSSGINQLDLSLMSILLERTTVLLCGDFNAPGIDWSKLTPAVASSVNINY